MAAADPAYAEVAFERHRRQRKKRVVRVGAWANIAVLLPWIGFALLQANTPLVAMNLVALAITVLTLHLCRRDRINAASHLLLVCLIAYVACAALLVEGVGSGQPNYVHHWLLVIAMAMLMALYDARRAVVYGYLSACAAIYAVVELHLVTVAALAPLPPAIAPIYPQLTMLPVFMVVIAITSGFVADIRRAEALLARANAKLETLVENTLPRPVPQQLPPEARAFADGVEHCSVLFADIVDFTPVSGERTTEQPALLHRLFGQFDGLAERFGVERINTIGGAYMAATGTPEPCSDHAARLARFALAMRDCMAGYPGVSLRIGINSGPVVAGVIGKKRYIYDLWGDAVNIAQRMESQGVSGAIQVTRSTHTLISGQFDLLDHGPLAPKGHGSVEAFLLMGEKPRPFGAEAGVGWYTLQGSAFSQAD